MLKPSLEEVQALAKEYNTIPVFYTFCADHQTPMNIYRCMAEKETIPLFWKASATAHSGIGILLSDRIPRKKFGCRVIRQPESPGILF